MKKINLLLVAFFCIVLTATAQKQIADSLTLLLAKEKIDTVQINLMEDIAKACYIYNPDTAIFIAQKALFFAKNINYTDGESRLLNVLANAFVSVGNYPRGLEYYIKRLKLVEKKGDPKSLAGIIINIGIVYVYQEEYKKALSYFNTADSIIALNNIQDYKYNIALNIGDVYNRQDKADSAFLYFNKSLQLANQMQDGDLIGTSMTGLGHSYLKLGNYNLAMKNYKEGLKYVEIANDDVVICEATIGLSKLYEKLNKNDSAEYFARYSFFLAKKDGFQSWQLDAANFLTQHYKKLKNTDSAFTYMEQAQGLKDSINSKERIRESQIMSSNEQLRQHEIAENVRKAKVERAQQLQLLFIGIFIPALFLVTLLLSKRKIPVRVIKFLGIISLLILFEYLTLLLHPLVVEFTQHTPLFEMLIFVTIASLLIPTHHRIENWLIEKLTIGKKHYHDGNFIFRTLKLKIKKTS